MRSNREDQSFTTFPCRRRTDNDWHGCWFFNHEMRRNDSLIGAIGGSKVTIGHDCGKVHESFADCVGAIGPITRSMRRNRFASCMTGEHSSPHLLQIIELCHDEPARRTSPDFETSSNPSVAPLKRRSLNPGRYGQSQPLQI